MPESVARISVLIRSVGRPTLTRALLSVYAQDLTLRIVVVCADGRPIDGLPNPPADMTLEVSLPDHPLARGAAANHLLERAGTELALFLDDDDELLAGHLQRLAQALDEHPQAAAAFAGVQCVTGAADAPQATVHVYDRDVNWADLQLQNLLPIHAVMFRTAVVDAAPALRMAEQLEQFEDWDFWLQLMARGADFVRVPGVSAVYHLDPDAGSGHTVPDSEKRRRSLEGFARLQLARWTEGDVAALIERHSQLLGNETQRHQELQQAREQWAAAQAAYTAAVQDAARIRVDLATVQAHAAALESDRDRVTNERQALQAHTDALHRQTELLQTQITDLQVELDGRQGQIEALQARTAALQQQAEFLQTQVSALQADRDGLQGQLEAYRREGDLLAALRLDHLQQIERLQAQITAIHRSTSWRLTGPMRRVGRALAFV
ncbi:MAG: glycosyltransferase, partial [Rubrivivax sp.]|nr:glycosyltransferase [Rubrivivax sp.]